MFHQKSLFSFEGSEALPASNSVDVFADSAGDVYSITDRWQTKFNAAVKNRRMIKQHCIKLGVMMLKLYALVSILFFSALILALLNKGVFMFSYATVTDIFTNASKTAKRCEELQEKNGLEKVDNK